MKLYPELKFSIFEGIKKGEKRNFYVLSEKEFACGSEVC